MKARLARSGTAVILGLALLAPFSVAGEGATGRTTTVSITSVSGYAGHAFVFAEVSDSGISYPAPTGTSHHSPFFSEWVPEPFPSPGCPWIWAVYVFDRISSKQVNLPSGTPPSPNFGTTTTLCADPTRSPVEQPPTAAASARLDLDLVVQVNPPLATVGSESIVLGSLSSRLSEDLNLYLSMAIEDWRVTRWTVDFGDGQSTVSNGIATTSFQAPHRYAAAGRYDARLTALITGHAQAAVYDGYGNVHLIQRPFSVEIGNHALATTRPAAIRGYLPPEGVVAVIPGLGGQVPSSAMAFRKIDALRGALTTLVVQLWVIREGALTMDGTRKGNGISRLAGWRLDGLGSDAPPGSGTAPGVVHAPNDPLRLQWNRPDRLVGNLEEEYVVPVTLFVSTRYPDGYTAMHAIRSSFSVSVNFAALGG
jgi:hypothetical protein